MPRIFLLLALPALLAGCASPTAGLDEHFGQAVLPDKQAQYLHPDAGNTAAAPAGLDGTAAQAVIARYHQSFKSPPPTVNVINIGGSLTGNGSSAR